MHIEATATFVKLYRKLPGELKERTKKALQLLETNPQHPSLGHKKMAGQEDIFEVRSFDKLRIDPERSRMGRISKNYRLTYQRIENTAYLRKIGTHNLLRNP